MSRTPKARWRTSRDTIPSKRRSRRVRRRHTKRGGTYYPMETDHAIAKVGIGKQLRLGTIAIATAMICFVLGLVGNPFAILAFLGIGFISLAFGIALISSARREERIHRLEDESLLVPVLEMEKDLHSGEDGSL